MTTAITPTRPVDGDQRREMIRQIGRMNFLAISGGRVRPLEDGIEMPVGSGFVVRVRLTVMDEYIVQRVFKRGGKEFDHGTKDRVYCSEVGEQAYRASSFRSYDKGEW